MKRKISLDNLLTEYMSETYTEQVKYINGLIQSEKLKPIKSAGTNGKKPALWLSYWLIEQEKNRDALKAELCGQLAPKLSWTYYYNHLAAYEQDRESVLKLSNYLYRHSDRLALPMSENERSFEIWGAEKFLTEGKGKSILKKCNLELSYLNCYATVEPFSYFALSRQMPQQLLILENNDPFFSMRGYLLESGSSICGEDISTLIYGGGKRVCSSFKEFSLSAEPYMKHEKNQFLYLGDLDYEGIRIYETLEQVCGRKLSFRPFVAGYRAMLHLAHSAHTLPQTKDGQSFTDGRAFFRWFPPEDADEIRRILEAGQYIPQEILNSSYFDLIP